MLGLEFSHVQGNIRAVNDAEVVYYCSGDDNGSDSLCTTNYVPNTTTLGAVNDHFGFCSHESDGIHVL